MNGLLVFIEISKKKFFLKKKIQNGLLKNSHFPAPPILNIFYKKIHGLVLGLVELIDTKGGCAVLLSSSLKVQQHLSHLKKVQK